MLNAKTIEIIKSTVPVLEVHGNAITTRFYERLFTNHPEMPTFKFKPDDAIDAANYLKSIQQRRKSR